MKNTIIHLVISCLLFSASMYGKTKNVLFIPVDDLKPLIACYGYSFVHTPNIDRLAERGTVFINTSCQQAVCGPSRASLMTGLYPDTTKVYDLQTKMRDVNPAVLTLPQFLKQKGYTTAGIGKTFDPRCVDKKLDAPSWSIPYLKTAPFPKNIGFPAGGFRNPKTRKEQRRVNSLIKEAKLQEKKKIQQFYRQFPAYRPAVESMDVPDDYYVDGNNTTHAIKLMGDLAAKKKPFFLSVGYSKPHLPFIAPKKYWDLYDRKNIKLSEKVGAVPGLPRWVYNPGSELRNGYTGIPMKGQLPDAMKLELIHGYLACVSYIDSQIGRLLDTLDELNIADKTVVCLWGDHGWHLGDHENWCKHSNFEEAVRSPLIIADPEQKDKGKKSYSPVEFVDIFPTLCESLKLSIPKHLEGKSLMPQLHDAQASVRKAALHQYPRFNKGKLMGYSLRSQRYRYTKWIQMDYRKGEKSGPLVGLELYDFEKDPFESKNLASDKAHAKVIKMFEDLFKERGVAQHSTIRDDAFGIQPKEGK